MRVPMAFPVLAVLSTALMSQPASAMPLGGAILATAGDPLARLTEFITTSGRNWAAAIIIIGALIAGGSIALGSQRAGEHARNFIIGGVFLGLVALGRGLYDLVASWVQ